jgi:hypothetical protein
MRAFELYVMTNPKDAREAQDKIYAIEAAKKMAEAERIVAREKEAKEPHFEGAWMVTSLSGRRPISGPLYEIMKNSSGSYVVREGPNVARDVQINGNRIRITFFYPNDPDFPNSSPFEVFFDLTLFEDGTKLIGTGGKVGLSSTGVILERRSR